ncbi:MAG: DUF3048 domain-containing protein [Ilumatobacteraceae bacterium]
MTFSKASTLLLVALGLVGCSTGHAAAPNSTIVAALPPTPTDQPSTTSSSTSTTAASTSTSTSTSSSSSTTTTIAPTPVMPLTGMPIVDPAIAARPAVVIKVSNDPGARPQSGLNAADIVFEAWGAGPTRFATVFQSTDAPTVGPIRSGRTQDVDLVGEFNGPVFACSGGNPTVVTTLRNSDLQVVTESQGPGWRLDPHRRRPHATFNDPASLRLNADPTRTGPAQQFHYRQAGQAATGDASAGFNLHIELVHVEWRFDAQTGRYERSQDGGPHLLADGTQVQADNVVVMWINYDHSFADARSPDGGSIGTGTALVFTGGKVTTVTWTRDDRLKPISFTDASGAPMLLTPGSTWIELANTGQGLFPGTDQLDVLPG